MARTHARLLTAIWTNDDFRQLDAATQRTYLLLMSQPDLSICGVLDYNPKRLARLAIDTTPTKINRSVATLEKRRYIVVDPDTDELAIRTFLRHDGVLDMPNPLKAAARAWKSIHSHIIRAVVVDALPRSIRAVWPDALVKMDATTIGGLLKQPLAEPFQQTLGGTLPPNPSTEPLAEPLGEPPGALALAGPLSSSGPPPSEHVGTNGSPPEPSRPDDDEDPAQQAIAVLTERRIEHEHPNGHGIDRPAAYRQSVIDDHRARHTDEAHELHRAHPDWPATRIADELDPQLAERDWRVPNADETHAYLEQRARDEAAAVPMPDALKRRTRTKG